jgi:integrase/recombinase XerD
MCGPRSHQETQHGAVYEKMKADLELRRYSPRTEKSYLYYAARFVRHFRRSPGEMGKAEIREFLLALERRGESASSLKLYVASIRFRYAVTLERPAEVEHIPWPLFLRPAQTPSG